MGSNTDEGRVRLAAWRRREDDVPEVSDSFRSRSYRRLSTEDAH